MFFSKVVPVALCAAMVSLFVSACEDDSSGGGNGDESSVDSSDSSANGVDKFSDYTVDELSDLPMCSSKREGASAYISGENADYVCDGDDWVLDVGDVSSEEEKSSSSVADDVNDPFAKTSSSVDEKTSSGVKGEYSSGEMANASSGVAPKSSSSVKSSSSEVPPSSSSAKSSSSVAPKSSSSVKSSSSEVPPSSSSVESSSSVDFSSSSFSEIWSWDVPRRDRLNPEIMYGTITDKRDNNVYKTVKICSSETGACQTWMAENLNYAGGVKSTARMKYEYEIAEGQIVKSDSSSWCYENNPDYCDVTGRLYTWAAAVDSLAMAFDPSIPPCGYNQWCTLPKTVRGICPEGWHLPSIEEWYALIDAVGGTENAGKALKSQSGWVAYTKNNVVNNGNGSDAYGFSMLPAGHAYPDGAGSNKVLFYAAGIETHFWSVTQSTKYKASVVNVYCDRNYALKNYSTERYRGYAVRCLMD